MVGGEDGFRHHLRLLAQRLVRIRGFALEVHEVHEVSERGLLLRGVDKGERGHQCTVR